MFRTNLLRILVVVTVAVFCSPSLAQSRQIAFTPEESLQQLVLEPDFSSRVLASEPHVIDPVDVAIDDAGRLWVVEMRDYPIRISNEPRGRIRVLTDTDADGFFDSSSVFADKLEMPTGLAHWKDGLVVTLAGKLIYLRDIDGDLVADETQVWLEGFSEDNEQLRANHPRLGPDGKWTIASGLRGGNIQLGDVYRSTETEKLPVNIGSRDVRFDPATGTIELITGPAQFGLCFDVFGSRYFCSNRNPAVKVVFEQEDLVGNPLAGILPSVVDVVPAGEQSQVFPLVDAWTTSNLHAGQFTAACGVFVRLHSMQIGTHEPLVNEIFTCEPTGSLVKRSLVRVDGQPSTISGSADGPAEMREWLASRDAWFRPVNLAHAPDGGLLLVDMHRAVIEHPQWVPEELKHRPDERWGEDCGRVLWIGEKSNDDLAGTIRALQARPLSTRTDTELVSLVTSSNPWMRETATRLLIERESHGAANELFVQWSKPELPLAGRIAAVVLAIQLAEELPAKHIREQTQGIPVDLQVAFLRALRQSRRLQPEHTETLAELATSVHSQVCFESLLCLGQLIPLSNEPTPLMLEIGPAVAASDAYSLVAAASALRAHPERLLTTWLRSMEEQKSLVGAHTTQIARALAAASARLGEAETTFSEIAETAFVDGAESRTVAALAALTEWTQRDVQLASKLLEDAFWVRLAAEIQSAKQTLNVRGQAIELLSFSPRVGDIELLGRLAMQEQAPALKPKLLQAWARQGGADCDNYLIRSISSSSPTMLPVLLQLVAQSPTRLNRLSQELSTGGLTAKQIGAIELKKLVTRASGESKETLTQELGQLVNSNRGLILAEYQACLELHGDPRAGKEVFRAQCATCHRIADVGVQVGPDISDSRTQQPLQLLTSILNPNLAIDSNYFRYVILTKDDEIVEGMVAEETADAIVIRGQEDRRTVVRRVHVAEVKATGVSMMPDGLEAQINHQAMADLIAYIKGWRYLDGAIPGK
jgi:putative membrane-bound dehydrogenase-like protein